MAAINDGVTTDLAKSDIPNARFNRVMVTTTEGSVVYDTVSGDTITLASVPVGVWIPTGIATNIRVVSTAVGFMVN